MLCLPLCCSRATSPTPRRPSSGSRMMRQGHHSTYLQPSSTSTPAPSTSAPSTTAYRPSSRYPVSPTVTAPSSGNPASMAPMGMAVPFNNNDDFTPEELQVTATKRRQDMVRTPEVSVCVFVYVDTRSLCDS